MGLGGPRVFRRQSNKTFRFLRAKDLLGSDPNDNCFSFRPVSAARAVWSRGALQGLYWPFSVRLFLRLLSRVRISGAFFNSHRGARWLVM